MRKSLVKTEPDSIGNAVDEVVEGVRSIHLPLSEKPIGLNDINVLAYSIIEEGLYDLGPRELNFCAQMTSASSISFKQRNWLKTLAKKYVGIDVDGDKDDGDFTVNVESVKAREEPANDDAPPKKRGRPKKTA